MSKKKLSFKEFIDISKWALGISWKISKFFTISSFATRILRELNGILNTYVLARVVDILIKYASEPNTNISVLIPWIIVIGVVQILTIGISAWESYTNRSNKRILEIYINKLLYEKVNNLGIQTLQLPDIANREQKAKDWLGSISDIFLGIVRIAASLVRAVIAGIIVFNFSPIITFGVIVISIIYYIENTYFFREQFKWQTLDKNIEGRRSSWFNQSYLTTIDSIDEVSLYGAYKFFDNKYLSFYNYYLGRLINLMKKDTLASFGIDLLNVILIVYGTVDVFSKALKGLISVGQTTFILSSINNFYSGLSWFFTEVVFYSDLLVKQKEVYEFFNLESDIKDGDIKLERLLVPPAIEFKKVSFKYPNTDKYIFKNFSLRIDSGEKIAIVGENGAGKTTLVKLLCRFYDVESGEILVNGYNIRDLKIDDWYKNVGVLFQDYNFYENLTVKENIYLGKSLKKIDYDKVIEASKNADAYDFIVKYKKGFDTIMSERFKGGVKPSKGQQQKIAIARFFYRDAPLAIFDEPTASIDAEAEYRIFNRIYRFFDNKTVIIISHRFSTVRNADKIVVIKDGSIIDEGSHTELMDKKGLYYNTFIKQAEGYN